MDNLDTKWGDFKKTELLETAPPSNAAETSAGDTNNETAPAAIPTKTGEATGAEELASNLTEAVKKKQAKKRLSAIMSDRVVKAIDAKPMNKGMNWVEYSTHGYERFGRHKAFNCACSANLFGISGLCRICGTSEEKDPVIVERTQPKTLQAVNCCWSDDLYELCSPLLQPNPNLTHSEQQYVLRAIRQRLKNKPNRPKPGVAFSWDWKGPTKPLKSAVDAGCLDLVFIMLEGSMDPNEADPRGVTGLHDASFGGRADICRVMLEGKAEVDPVDRHGQTPLFFAGNVDVCKLLCERQADVGKVNIKGQTPLHLAGRGGLRDVVEWLSQNGGQATLDLRDSCGATATQYLMISSPLPNDLGSSTPPAPKSKGKMRSKSERRWKSRDPSIQYRDPSSPNLNAENGRSAGSTARARSKPPEPSKIAAANVAELQNKLSAMEQKLKLATESSQSPVDLIRRVKQIESKGRVLVDLTKGDVESVKPIEFVSKTQHEDPTAEFVDGGSVDPVLSDFCEIANMFNVPIEIQGHTAGGSCEFSQKLALNRAQLIVERLIALGVEQRLLTARGFPGETGKNTACVVVKLDMFEDDVPSF